MPYPERLAYQMMRTLYGITTLLPFCNFQSSQRTHF